MEYKITRFIRIKDQKIHLADQVIFAADEDLELQDFLRLAYSQLKISYPRFHKMDELSKLGILATDLLFRHHITQENTALVFSNYSSSLGTDKIHQKSIDQTVSPAIFVYTLPNIVMGEICIRNKIYGENAFFISENFDADLVYEYSQSLLESKLTTAIVCGWIEWKNAEYDVFLCLITREGKLTFSAENLKALYNFENE